MTNTETFVGETPAVVKDGAADEGVLSQPA